MQVMVCLLMSSRAGVHPNQTTKRQRVAFPSRNPFVSSAAVDGKSVWSYFSEWDVVSRRFSAVRRLALRSSFQLSATLKVDQTVTTSSNASEPTLDVSTISIGDSSTITAEWSQLASTTYMDAG